MSNIQVTANQLNLPQRNSFQETFIGGPGNDVLIGSNERLSILDHNFELNSGGASFENTNGDMRVPLGSLSSSPFQLFNHEGLTHFINNSNTDLKIDFTTEFFDLLLLNQKDKNETNVVKNVLLFDDKFYGVQFFVDERDVQKPLSIATGLQTSTDNFDFDFHILTPSGVTQTIRSVLPRFVNSAIPLVPYESGTYTLFVQPRDGDVVLDQFAILDNFLVEQVENGCIKTYQGTKTKVDFFRPGLPDINQFRTDGVYFTEPNGDVTFIGGNEYSYDHVTGEPLGNIEVDGYSYQDPIVQDLDNAGEMFGSSDIRVHSPSSPFGGSVFFSPQSSFHRGDTIISTMVAPPDLDNPSVRKERSEIGLPAGYEVELGFWWNFEPLQELPTEGISINLFNQPQDYFYNLDHDMIVGFNDTVTSEFSGGINSDAFFMNLNNEERHWINARDNDILNFDNTRLDVIPAGNYSVTVSGSHNAWVEFNFFPFEKFDTSNVEEYKYNLDEFLFYEIPASDILLEAFNFTYTDTKNMSAHFDISLFDSSGSRIDSDQFTWSNYGNLENFTHVKGITDEMAGGISKGGTFIQIHHTGNDYWNTSKLVPDIIESDDLDEKSTLQIRHIDNIVEGFPKNNPNGEIFTGPLTTPRDLNVSKSTILGYFDYTSAIGGNRLILTAENMSMEVRLIVEGTNVWSDVNSVLRIIEGVDFYVTILEFATLLPIDFIVEIEFEAGSLNGTFNTEVEKTIITNLPEILLRTFSFTPVGEDGAIPENIAINTKDDGFALETTLLVTGGIVAVGLIVYRIQGRGLRRE